MIKRKMNFYKYIKLLQIIISLSTISTKYDFLLNEIFLLNYTLKIKLNLYILEIMSH